MNPFMLRMMNPMGIGFMPFSCCCGVNMPYYGSNDMLTFMNFPIFRNQSLDYMLDPRLAWKQVQEQCQFGGGSLFGNSYLPLFNNFPGIQGGMSPWWNPTQSKTESEEEKKKREAKEAEGKKPEAVKATALKKVFDNIKKLAEENKSLVNLDSSIIKKAEEAMKKETAAEQYTAMKEVISAIPDSVLRKSILANDEVKKQLIEAGYNFNYSNNAYSLPVTSITDNLIEVYDSISSKLSATSKNTGLPNNTGLPILAANVTSGKTPILAAISAWNNTQNEKGILNFISKNIPTEEGPLLQMKDCVTQLVNALLEKADEYSGCTKIKNDRNKLVTLKTTALNKFDSTNVNNLSVAFERLYARLRMQEAVKVRNYIQSQDEFKCLNEVKSDLISDDMIVKETYECLKKEGISNVPAENDLDKIASATVVTVGDEGVIDPGKKYENNPQGLLDEYLVNEKHVLTKVGDVYATKDFDGKGSGVKYYTIQDGKVVETTKKADGTFEVKDSTAVNYKTVEDYDAVLKTIESMLNNKSIEQCKDFPAAKLPYPVFKAATKNEYFALIGNTFGRIKNCTGIVDDKNNFTDAKKTNHKIHATGTNKTLDALTETDLEDFDSNTIKSKAQEEKDKKAAEDKKKAEDTKKRVSNITKDKYAFITMSNHLNELGLETTGVKGFYKTKESPVLFFKYDMKSHKLQHLANVSEVRADGTMKVGNTIKYCQEVETAAESAKELQGILNTTAYKDENYLSHKSKD